MIYSALAWVIVGGLLEPLWVIGLKRFNERTTFLNLMVAVAFMLLSPLFLSFGMKSLGVGVSYSIWTGIGAVATLLVGRFLYHESFSARKALFAILIVAGVVGLEVSNEVFL